MASVTFLFHSPPNEPKAASTSVRECKTNAKMHVKHIMWVCRRTAFAFIRLCGVCSANTNAIHLELYFKKKAFAVILMRNACSFACAANAEQATFWHSFAFASVLHAMFAFTYRSGHASRLVSHIFGPVPTRFVFIFHQIHVIFSHFYGSNNVCIRYSDIKVKTLYFSSASLFKIIFLPSKVSNEEWFFIPFFWTRIFFGYYLLFYIIFCA